MKKKWLSYVLAVSVMAGCLTGCGSKPAEKKEEVTEPVKTEDGREMAGNTYTTGSPIVKEKETFHIVASVDSRQQEFNDMEFFKKLEEQSNIHIEWELIEAQDYEQKKSLILASGEYPDAFFNRMKNKDLNTYVPQGVFIPISDYMEYAPQLEQAFAEHPDYKNMCTYQDGKVYSLGNANEDPCQYQPDEMYVYQPWLDKLGLKVPETIDEFAAMLRAFKEQDPNGNGKQDEIPFSARTNGAQGFHSLSGAFGPAMYFDPIEVAGSFVYEDNGTIKFGANTEDFKEFVTFCNQMFKEGLFDQEIFTQDVKQYFAKGKTDEVTLGCFMLWNSTNMAGIEREKDYIPIPTLKGPEGDQNWCDFQLNNGTINGTEFVITSACKNPEALVRWVDQFYDKKTSVEAVWGPLQEETRAGMYLFTPFPEDKGFDKFRYENCPVFGPSCVYAADYNSFVEMPSMMVSKVNELEKYYNIYPKTKSIPLMNYTEEESEWFMTTGNDIHNYVFDNLAKWMMNGGIEEEWDAYVSQLDKLGVNKHVEIIQKAYDRHTGK